MNLLKRFHKDRPSPDDEMNQEPMEEEQGSIDVEPQSEPVKRINRGIIFLIGVVFIGALGATMYSCDGPTVSKTKVDVSNSRNDVLTDQQMDDLEKKAALDKENKNAPGNDKTNKNNVSGGKNQKYYIDKNGNYIARDSSSSPSSTSSSSRRSYNSSSASSAPSASSQPAPITPYEKYQEDSQKAYYKRRLSDEETAASEERNGQKSQIFFNLDGDKKAQEKKNTSSEPAANQYYNDGTIPENSSSDDDYIQVVGPRQQKGRW
ncbi:hypothetical protein [Dialister succinatiphilus]|jgi:hypothetical protein|uniref:hypothetical protein n=1 Tax=Dialister succinatiphilus TaxID=487173 RepID=UPI0023564E4A|nr:hypothetical protein [Dialister succinatiphilus]